jgi:hypothetical protein
MSNTKAVNMEISRLGKQVSKFVLRYKGENLMDRVQAILDMELAGFESIEIAKTLVFRAMSKEAYETIFVPVGMDQYGNYTEDSSLWA